MATLNSLLAQTFKPSHILIVDDGSDAETKYILSDFARNHPSLISIFTFKDLGKDYRKIVYFYNYCLERVPSTDFHLILADDILLPENYAEYLINKMQMDETLAVCSGNFDDGCLRKPPITAAEMVRESFFHSFKKYPAYYGFEIWLLYESLFSGNKIANFNELTFKHLRPLASEHKFKDFGKADYCLGYHPLYMILTCSKNLFRREGIYSFQILAEYLFCHLGIGLSDGFSNRDNVFRNKVRQHTKQLIFKFIKHTRDLGSV